MELWVKQLARQGTQTLGQPPASKARLKQAVRARLEHKLLVQAGVNALERYAERLLSLQ